MPELNQTQSPREGQSFFANDGEDSGLPELDPEMMSEMERNQTELKYGEHSVSLETLNFLEALEPELGREWIEDNLGTEDERIRLNERGDILYLSLSLTSITTLPELPASLIELFCSDTPLVALPKLPVGLKKLYCAGTKITILPELPNSLEEIYLKNTPLSEHPGKMAEISRQYPELYIF